MPANPYFHAIAASAYIFLIGAFLTYLESTHADKPDTFIVPIGFLSLLVLSVAVMAFLFFYRPITLLLENKRKNAVSFFFKTLGTFALITAVILFFIATT